MSILGINLLNEIITKYENIEVNDILNELRSRVISLLKQTIDFNSIKDGMDISICCIDEKRNILEYAGAFSTTYLIKDKNLIEIKGDRMPIGIHEEINTKFSKQNIEIEKDMKIYLFSDGYMDQFGGENNRKLKSKGFQQIVYKISELPMNEQKEKFEEALINWMGSNEQIDDITLIGIKI